MIEEKIKKIILDKYGSIRQFALKIDIPYTTIDSILKRGIDNSNVGNVIKMCKALNISVDKLIENNELISNLEFDNADYLAIDSDTVQIPVLGTIKAGIPIEAQQEILEYVEIPKKWTAGGKKFYGLKISGDSMFPKYQEGDIVIFEQNEDKEMFNGKDCAVMVNGNDATFKKVLLNENGITLIPYNTAKYEMMIFSNHDIENLPIKIIGIAKEKRTKL
jgi:repressor LexA